MHNLGLYIKRKKRRFKASSIKSILHAAHPGFPKTFNFFKSANLGAKLRRAAYLCAL